MPLERDLRLCVIEAAQALTRERLSAGTSGNVSVRLDADGAMLITPTGVAPDALTADMIVCVNADGTWDDRDGTAWAPSSERLFHGAIYAARPDIGAIVHCHSDCATALACTGRGIPAFHYMIAAAGGPDIRCAPYATFGTDALADHAVAALDGRRACLLAHHGQIAAGATLDDALTLAIEVEALARQYVHVLSIGGGALLDAEEMARVLKKFETYGQQPETQAPRQR